MLRRFIHNGRLLAMPAAHGKRLVVLDHLAGLFEPGRRYPEPEVNELLGRYHPDYAMLRRYLVDDGFLDRADEQAGSRTVKVYWRTGGTVDTAGAYFFLNRSLASAKVAVRASLSDPAAFLVCSPTCGSRTASPRALNACSSDSLSFSRASSTLRRSAERRAAPSGARAGGAAGRSAASPGAQGP